MFSTIFNFEVKRWLKGPAFYIYCAIFFGISLFSMMSSLGVFDNVTASTSSPVYVNSPLNIAGFLNGFSTLVYFLLPTIIGASVYRDYQTNVYQLLFSYPLNKESYLSAKFLSSLFITILVTLACVAGFIVGQFMPNVNHELLGPNNFLAYLQAYFTLIIPNLILFGLIVFAIVNYARNIYVGFIFILVLFVVQTVLSILTSDVDNRYLVALLDPFGFEPIVYYTKYWSIEEQNNNYLPLLGVMLYNRLIWLGLAVVIGFVVYRSFSFSHLGHSFGQRKNGKRLTKENFQSVIYFKLPEVNLNYNFWSRLKTAWNLSHIDFKYIVRNWTFIVIMVITLIFVLIIASTIGQLFGTETYPVTWKMLEAIGSIYGFFVTILIFLFAGMLIQRARISRMDLIIDATAIPNWVFFFSKFLALIKMTALILLISLLSGVIYQIYEGYYSFELGLYFKELFVLDMLKYLVLILFALFIHSFFKNYIVGFVFCLILFIGFPLLSKLGVEQSLFKFNQGPSYTYSDMNGYGDVRHYVYYKLYWLLLMAFLSGISLLLWRRGLMGSMKDRWSNAKKRLSVGLLIPTLIALVGFLGLGYAIYYQTNIAEPYFSNKEKEQQQVDYETHYKKYENLAAPRLVDVKLYMDIFPKERDYKAKVDFVYINKTSKQIDTLFVSHDDNLISWSISTPTTLVLNDSILHIKLFQLERPLQPSDTLRMSFEVVNKPNTFLRDKSPILENGTFLSDDIFPSLSYKSYYEIMDPAIRKKYNLPPKERMPEPTDLAALNNNYITNDADWIDFEAFLSTSDDQIAIAPGYLQKEWKEGDRRHFHYKMDNKILNFYSIMSARYEVLRDKWEDIDLEIYYHKGHEYNLDRMMTSMKKSLEYYEENYSPYQFNQMRVIEFPKTKGTFAQAFANTVPFSESIGFIAKVDDENPNGVDYAYAVTAHEFAHQWWAHQVIGAYAKGATMMSESLSEYSSLKVLEKTYGEHQMRKFLKDALDQYLLGRSSERIGENPLMYNENQSYIHYNKGSLVMYAMSDFLGEKQFNNILSEYIDRTAFQYPPYTTSIEFVDLIKNHTPDSLQYLIKDMFETITLYDNQMKSVSTKELENGKYQVDIQFKVSKYRSDSKGKQSFEDLKGTALKEKIDKEEVLSLPLQDYVEIAVFGEPKMKGKHQEENILYVRKHKIDRISNTLSLVVDQKPFEVGVDPYNKLIDRDSNDNRKKI